MALVVLLGGSHAGAQSSVEAQVFAEINANRSTPLGQHAGLLEQARAHARTMSARGNLTHAGSSSRPTSAAPDPAEPNGAPDDGYDGSYCENIAYVSVAGNGSVAGRLYASWDESASHRRCMRNTRMNVGAVGVHNDGTNVWATFIAMSDSTPPGSRPAPTAAPTQAPLSPTPIRTTAAPVPSPAPASAQTAPGTPTPTTPSAPTPSLSPTVTRSPTPTTRDLAVDSEPTQHAGYGLREGIAIAGLLGFSAGGVAVVRFRSRN